MAFFLRATAPSAAISTAKTIRQPYAPAKEAASTPHRRRLPRAKVWQGQGKSFGKGKGFGKSRQAFSALEDGWLPAEAWPGNSSWSSTTDLLLTELSFPGRHRHLG